MISLGGWPILSCATTFEVAPPLSLLGEPPLSAVEGERQGGVVPDGARPVRDRPCARACLLSVVTKMWVPEGRQRSTSAAKADRLSGIEFRRPEGSAPPGVPSLRDSGDLFCAPTQDWCPFDFAQGRLWATRVPSLRDSENSWGELSRHSRAGLCTGVLTDSALRASVMAEAMTYQLCRPCPTSAKPGQMWATVRLPPNKVKGGPT